MKNIKIDNGVLMSIIDNYLFEEYKKYIDNYNKFREDVKLLEDLKIKQEEKKNKKKKGNFSSSMHIERKKLGDDRKQS